MYRVIWTCQSGCEFEDFSSEDEASDFRDFMEGLGFSCEIGEVPPYNRPRWDV